MANPLETFAQTLKNNGQKLTPARRQVFMAMQDKEPQTMREIIESCGPMDRASVYRTIALFERLGIVKRLQIGWKYKLELTDAFHRRHHHHLTCQHCGKIIPFNESAAFAKHLHTLAAEHDFDMRDHQLEIQGYCSGCQAA
jgi:Fe2+ or Zn2+ uptake regulation protein